MNQRIAPRHCNTFGLFGIIQNYANFVFLLIFDAVKCKNAELLAWMQGCGSAFLFCVSGSKSFSQCGSGSRCFLNADPDLQPCLACFTVYSQLLLSNCWTISLDVSSWITVYSQVLLPNCWTFSLDVSSWIIVYCTVSYCCLIAELLAWMYLAGL